MTGAHFDDLKQRYGHPLVVLNLLKSREKRGREVVLRRELATAVNLLNAQVRTWHRDHLTQMGLSVITLELLDQSLQCKTGSWVMVMLVADCKHEKPNNSAALLMFIPGMHVSPLVTFVVGPCKPSMDAVTT